MRFVDKDILQGMCAWRIWLKWAWIDIRQRYRRSRLGTFWLTLSLGVTVGGMSVVFGGLFGQDIKSIMPYIASGMIAWTLILGIISEGCLVFISAKGVIMQINLPLTVHVMRHLMRQAFMFLHHVLIIVLVCIVFSVPPTLNTLLIIPGLILYFINGIWVGLLLGMVCARYRDVPQVVNSVLQLIFFVTPIFWRPDFLSRRTYIIHVNPLYHYLEIVREPMLGVAPSMTNWLVVLSFTAIGMIGTLYLYRRFHHRVSYWI